MNKVGEISFETIKNETLRVIVKQSELLEKIKEISSNADVIAENKQQNMPTQQGYFTAEALDKKIATLDENNYKVNHAELVATVVGTMKAGKSTFINAVVGQEILPNRSRPMTALPTLIKHKPGQSVPVLVFTEEQQEPIKELVIEIVEKLKTDPKVEEDLKGLEAELKSDQFSLGHRYEGQDNIFKFLINLNDLVRLTKALELQFPFKEYASIKDFPCIEVEFAHIKEQQGQENYTHFSLLDTPGFNEAAQVEDLKSMFVDQLQKATVVLAVLDYTQLNSEANHDLNKELKGIAEYAGDRLLFVLNKFDANKSNDESEETTIKIIHEKLLKNLSGEDANLIKIKKEDIYPVSSLLAYLANRASIEINKGGSLGWVEGSKKTWVDDFGKEAFGELYSEDINSNDRVAKAVNALLKKSKFDSILQAVSAYHNNALSYTLDAAIAKLRENASLNRDSDKKSSMSISNFLSMRLHGLYADKADMEKIITDLNEQLDEVEKIKNKHVNELGATFEDIEGKIKNNVNIEKAKRVIEDFFQKKVEDKRGSRVTKALKSIFPNMGEPESDENSTIVFDNKDAAELELHKISTEINAILTNSATDLNKYIAREYKRFKQNIENVKNEINTSELLKNAQNAGFDDFEISIPELTLMTNTLDKANFIDDESTTRSYTIDEKGFIAWLKRRISKKWGQYERTEEIPKFVVNIVSVKDYWIKSLEKRETTVKNTINKDFIQPLKDSQELFFEQLNESFASVREAMQDSLNDQLKTSDEKEEIANAIKSLQKLNDEIDEDITDLDKVFTQLSKGL